MRIGVPKEIKVHEYRVGLTPSSVRELVAHGHQVIVERDAGRGIGAADAVYERAGASIVAGAAEVFARADMIVKVKEPQPAERKMLRAGQVLFTYLHLAPDPEQCADLIDSGAVCNAKRPSGAESSFKTSAPPAGVAKDFDKLKTLARDCEPSGVSPDEEKSA